MARLSMALLLLGSVVVGTSVFALADGGTGEKDTKKDIVDTAVAAGKFKTLAAALEKAELIETLKGKGPFTVFAPTDEAFKKLPEGTVEGLLKDKKALTSVLLYHVVAGKVTAEDVVKLKSAKTVQGQKVRIGTKKGVQINNAKVIKADVFASNGVIHVIDTVLIPPKGNGKKSEKE